jgi:hypothetical protein
MCGKSSGVVSTDILHFLARAFVIQAARAVRESDPEAENGAARLLGRLRDPLLGQWPFKTIQGWEGRQPLPIHPNRIGRFLQMP